MTMIDIPAPPPDKPLLLITTAALCDVVAELQSIDGEGLAAAVAAANTARRATGVKRRRHLVRAAALLLAEIERYDEDPQ